MSQDWNDPDFQTSIAQDAMESDRKIEELQTENARFRKALEEIASVAHISERKPVQNILSSVKYKALKALRGPSPA